MRGDGLNRRQFVKLAGLSAVTASLAACVAPAAGPGAATESGESAPAAEGALCNRLGGRRTWRNH